MAYLSYLFFRFVVFVFSLLPFGAIYGLSNILCWLFADVLKYRHQVIFKNLEIAFPEKSIAEKEKIARKFYQNLSDITLESIKGLSMSQDKLMERFQFVNPELLDETFEAGQSVLIIGGHFGNWEWGAKIINPWLKHEALGIFKPLRNPYINKYTTQRRGKHNTILIPMKETRAAIEKYGPNNSAFAFVADQTPSNMITTLWIPFMNKLSAFPPGPEMIARAHQYPVYFYDISRRGRGRYALELSLLSQKPHQLKEEELTQMFAQRVEAAIRRDPPEWLWSHKRWKREKGVEGVVNY